MNKIKKKKKKKKKCGTFENYLLKKLWRRAAPAAQRRPAGEPKARPGAFRRIRNTTPIKISDIFLQLLLLTSQTHFFTRSISRSFSRYFVAITPVRVHDLPVKNTPPPPGGGIKTWVLGLLVRYKTLAIKHNPPTRGGAQKPWYYIIPT